MRIAYAIEGGNYKKGKHNQAGEFRVGSSEFGCCYQCHLGVSTQVLGSLPSHRPSTSAVSVPLEWDAYPGCTVLFVFAISMCPDLFGGL